MHDDIDIVDREACGLVTDTLSSRPASTFPVAAATAAVVRQVPRWRGALSVAVRLVTVCFLLTLIGLIAKQTAVLTSLSGALPLPLPSAPAPLPSAPVTYPLPLNRSQCPEGLQRGPPPSYEPYVADPTDEADEFTRPGLPLRQLSVDVVNTFRQQHAWSASTGVRGVVAYLSRLDDVPELTLSLQILAQTYLNDYDYPVAIFHEDFTQKIMQDVQAAVPRIFIYFVRIEFNIPSYIQKMINSGVPMTTWKKGKGFGYSHMCRFFAGAVFRLPFFDAFDYYFRMDTDSVCRGVANTAGSKASGDVMLRAAVCGHEYIYNKLTNDPDFVVVELFNASETYAQEHRH
jgi:hypothetical protein